METNSPDFPIMDLHCDMLNYLAMVEGASPEDVDTIGCATPRLREGGVKLQVMAVFVPTGAGSADTAFRQCRLFTRLNQDNDNDFFQVKKLHDVEIALSGPRTGIVPAIENASGLYEEDEPLDRSFSRLERIIESVGPVLYISMTHHFENRFGGGNLSDVGLKDAGRALLDFLDNRKIAVDLSHTSDALARGILDYVDQKNLDIPMLASHSNFRSICNHRRNLPDDLAMEVIRRQGVIGVNFVRDFIDSHDPQRLKEHIRYGWGMGATQALCFGADFFYALGNEGCDHKSYFFKEHEHAGKYPSIMRSLSDLFDPLGLAGLSHKNGIRFLKRIWS
ncbi:MAG: membrane dipeptidase [Planctomycetota bacterium]